MPFSFDFILNMRSDTNLLIADVSDCSLHNNKFASCSFIEESSPIAFTSICMDLLPEVINKVGTLEKS